MRRPLSKPKQRTIFTNERTGEKQVLMKFLCSPEFATKIDVAAITRKTSCSGFVIEVLEKFFAEEETK